MRQRHLEGVAAFEITCGLQQETGRGNVVYDGQPTGGARATRGEYQPERLPSFLALITRERGLDETGYRHAGNIAEEG